MHCLGWVGNILTPVGCLDWFDMTARPEIDDGLEHVLPASNMHMLGNLCSISGKSQGR